MLYFALFTRGGRPRCAELILVICVSYFLAFAPHITLQIEDMHKQTEEDKTSGVGEGQELDMPTLTGKGPAPPPPPKRV
jgi:hypothetical protein